MGIIQFGTSRALARRSPLVPATRRLPSVEVGSGDTVGDVVEVGGDFTRGVGQGLGLVLGLVSAGWIASKMLR